MEEQAAERELDVAIFQEVWSPWRSFVACTIHTLFCCSLFGRHSVENSLKKVLPHFTKVHGSRACDCSKRFFDSGLMIASRFPILDEKFLIYPSGSPHDALSSKGALVAALERPDKTIMIVCSSHLDAGDDNRVKLEQLKLAIGLMKEFTVLIKTKYPSKQIVATIFGSDMNIDGIEFWSSSNAYATASQMLEFLGFRDAWLMTPRSLPSMHEVTNRNFNPDQHPQLGITSDQHECVKRLDYIWVCRGQMHAGAPPQQEMGTKMQCKTQLNEGVLWRSSACMREEVDKAVRNGDEKLAKKLAMQIDLHDREMRLSDHAALFAKISFSP
jgi:endonuclease/exonuclease/phosphatase family metal-dependent hydrolase